MSTFDPYLNGGVTRSPHHPKGKLLFATNFDDLEFKVDGKPLVTKDVQGAYPAVQCVLVFAKDDNGKVKLNPEGRPLTERVVGKVEIIGDCETCGCNMSKFKVAKWWEVELRG